MDGGHLIRELIQSLFRKKGELPIFSDADSLFAM